MDGIASMPLHLRGGIFNGRTAVIAARATSFIFSKMVLAYMDTFNLLAVRFLIAFILMAILFIKRLQHIGKGETYW